jgi:CheY-like chemotaxis protein/ligand-binding sensor domain-containing protein
MSGAKASVGKKKYLGIIAAGVLLNCLGRFIAIRSGCPALLDTLGTLLAAYYGGMAAGAVSAAVSGGLCALMRPLDIFYIIPGVAVAAAAAFLAGLTRYMKRFLGAMNATFILCVIKTLFLTAINIALFDGKTGLLYPDAIIDYLAVFDVPWIIRCSIASLYVCFTDMFYAATVLFIAAKQGKYIKRKRRAAELKKALGKKITLALLPALFFIPAYRVNADTNINFVQRLYNSENGMVGSCANDIVQTDDGTMWIGTYGGLYRFNGDEFRRIEDIDSVRSVQSLFVDSDNRLWVGSDGSGVTVIMPDRSSRVFDSSQGLPAGTVKDVVQGSDGCYYIGTTGGLAIVSFDGDRFRIRGIRGDIGSISDIELGESGEIAVLSSLGDVYIFRDRSLALEIDYDDIKATCVDYDQGGYLYVGTDSEYVYKYRLGEKDYVLTDVLIARGLNNINDIFFDETGYIFLASDTGIGYSDQRGNSNIISNEGFDNSVEKIFEDYQGNLWFTSSRCGLLALSRSSFTDLFSVCNVRDAVVNVVVENSGLIYVGTDDGLRILDPEKCISITNEAVREFDGFRVRSIAVDNDGELLIAAVGKPLMMLDTDGNLTGYFIRETDEEEAGRKIRVVKQLSNGSVITLGDDGICFVTDRKVSYKMKKSEELGNAVLLNAEELSDGTLLVGTDGDGIAVVKDRKVCRYITERDGLSSGVILRIVDDRRGLGAFVLTGSGMCYMEGDYKNGNVSVRELTEPPYYNNYDLYQRINGDIFITGGAGVYVIYYTELLSTDREASCKLLDIKSGLPGSLTSNSWNCAVDDSYIYLCGNKGVYKLDLENYEMEVTEYKACISSVKLDGEDYDEIRGDTIKIPLGTKKLEMDLGINNFTVYDPYVRYYMAGVDDEKITVKSSELEAVTYYNIPHGNNEFHIEVLSKDGMLLREKSYVISKDREVYETAGFQVYFYGILIVIGLYGINSVINGGIYEVTKRQKNEYEKIVGVLEREKKEAMERSLYIEEEASRAKMSFLDKMSSEIQTSVNAIAGMNTLILRETGQKEIKDYSKDINGALRRLKSVIAGMLGYEDYADDEDDKTAAERFHARDARILVADSIELNLSVAEQLLKRIHIKVDTASTGIEAIDKAMMTRYDIILIDSMMPEMSGEEVLKKIQDDCPLNADVPVIVTSTNAVRGARQEYLRLGFSNYLVKPIDAGILEAMVESYLPEEKIVLVNYGKERIDRSSAAVSPELLEELERLDRELGDILNKETT